MDRLGDRTFWTKVLCDHLHDCDNSRVHVLSVGVEQACEIGENFVSNVKRVQIDGYKIVRDQKLEYSTSLIVKLMHENAALVAQMSLDRIFRNEIDSYFKILPELKKYTVDGRLAVPECLYADDTIIVLENLCEQGYVNIDKYIGFDLAQVANILKELAKLHAASLAINNESKLTKLTENVYDLLVCSNKFADTQKLTFGIAIKLFKEEADTPKHRRCIALLEKIQENAGELQRTLVSKPRPYRVINHGDTWMNNILLKDESVRLIDLQMMRYTSVACDLSYFLHINLKSAIRRKNYHQLLCVYLEALHRCLNEVGVDMSKVLTMEWLLDEMNNFAVLGLISSMWLLPVFHFKKADLDMKKFTEDKTANVDYMWEKCSPEFKRVLKEIVYDFVDHPDCWKHILDK